MAWITPTKSFQHPNQARLQRQQNPNAEAIPASAKTSTPVPAAQGPCAATAGKVTAPRTNLICCHLMPLHTEPWQACQQPSRQEFLDLLQADLGNAMNPDVSSLGYAVSNIPGSTRWEGSSPSTTALGHHRRPSADGKGRLWHPGLTLASVLSLPGAMRGQASPAEQFTLKSSETRVHSPGDIGLFLTEELPLHFFPFASGQTSAG